MLARPLIDRLQAAPDEPAGGLQQAGLMLRWQQLLNRAAPGGMALRLKLANRTPRQAEAALAGDTAATHEAAPDWQRLLQQALEQAPDPRESAGETTLAPLSAGDRAVLAPFLKHARAQLQSQPRDRSIQHWAQLQEQALAHLATHLGSLLEPASRSDPPPAADPGPWLGRWPVLARLLAQATLAAIDNTADLLRQLARDLPEVTAIVDHGSAVAQPRTLQPGLSDPHQGGRQVAAITLDSGEQFFHKPRRAQLDLAWRGLLDWLQARELIPELHHAPCLDRPDGSWAAGVTASGCRSTAELTAFHERAGALLALAYLLRAGDLISDNLIAAGPWPCLIDAECLLSPPPLLQIQSPDSDTSTAAALRDTVAGTLMLPLRWHFDAGQFTEVSALTSRSALEAAGASQANQTLLPHMPFLNGRPVPVDDYSDAVLAGFERSYRGLLRWKRAHRGQLPPPLAAMRALHIRYIPRPTALYQQLLERARQPECLRDGGRRGLVFEYLARLHLQQPDPARLWPLFEAEVRALEQGDVPYFEVPVDGRDLLLEGVPLVRDAFSGTPFDRVLARWDGLCEQDLARQQATIRRLLGGEH